MDHRHIHYKQQTPPNQQQQHRYQGYAQQYYQPQYIHRLLYPQPPLAPSPLPQSTTTRYTSPIDYSGSLTQPPPPPPPQPTTTTTAHNFPFNYAAGGENIICYKEDGSVMNIAGCVAAGVVSSTNNPIYPFQPNNNCTNLVR